MQLIETNIEQRGLLPLPAAALVIDIRGVNDDEVVERLNIEIADLASEMKTYNVYHWRFLTDFLSFMRLAPSSAFDGNGGKDGNSGNTTQIEPQMPEEESLGPIGRVHQYGSGSSLFFQDERNSIVSGDMPFDLFEQKIDELIQEIDRIRNNRIAAVADLNQAGIPGRSIRDATVRVIFLTDAERQESLKSAAIYAERIKDYYRKRERPEHQQLVSTTVLCLGNSGEAGPPRKLIEGLLRNNEWKHLDTLILSEDYREDAALIAGTVQAYLAELLLYVLLIIPPFNVNSPMPVTQVPVTDENERGEKGHYVMLPANTFIVGLAALEYSARWGRRWLSYGLAKEAAEVIMRRPYDEVMERRRIDGSVEVWFQGWRNRIKETIPDKISGDVPALEGVLKANRDSDPSRHTFTTNRFSFDIGKSTIKDLNDYKDTLANTYIASTNEPTLQEAVLRSTPQIMHTLQERENRTLVERTNAPLDKLQIEVERILSKRNFFTNATGAIPRARTQLESIGAWASDLQNKHQSNPLNPQYAKEELKDKRDRLIAEGNKKINSLQDHLQNWPFFGELLRLRIPMAGLSIILFLLVNMVVVLLSLAWLNHLLISRSVGLVSYLDAPLVGVPTLELIAWGLIVTIAIIGLFIARSFLRSSSAAWVEFVFLLLLLLSALFGLLAAFSIVDLSNQLFDTVSIGFLSVLAFVPEYSHFAFVIFIVMVIIEAVYFVWWLARLRNGREEIVNELHNQHQQDVKSVTDFIADDITLQILRRAELINENGRLGEYYFRVDRLCKLMEEVVKKTQEQQLLAGKRLLLSQSETQEGFATANGGTWLNLHIRDEKLETVVLTDGYKMLRQRLITENDALREFAEFLLRISGVEKPVEIGQWFEQKPTPINGEPRRLQLLMTSLVTTTLRFSVDPISVKSINPILEQYKSTNEYARQHMPTLSTLIQILSKKMSQATLRSLTEQSIAGTQYSGLDSFQVNMSTDAVATWSQMFWQEKEHTLDASLMQDGVLAQLMRLLGRDYDPRAVMRRLLAHTSLFGRSISKERYGELFLLLAPSTQSYEFRQGLKALKLPRIIDFPDVERMLLLGVQHYVAAPLFLPEREAPVPRSTTNGLSLLNPALDENEHTVVSPVSNSINSTNGLNSANGMNGANGNGTSSASLVPTNGTNGTNGNGTSSASSVPTSDTNGTPASSMTNTVLVTSPPSPVAAPTVPLNMSTLSTDNSGSVLDKDDEEDSNQLQPPPAVNAVQNIHDSDMSQDNTVQLTPSLLMDDTMEDEEK